MNIFSFIHFENHLYFQPYQNGLESKKLFREMFLKLNFTSKYIWTKIPGAQFNFLKNLTEPYYVIL